MAEAPTLRTRERGRTSGRFVLPAALRAPSSDEGPIARALKELVQAERDAEGLAAPTDTIRHVAVTHTDSARPTRDSAPSAGPNNLRLRALLVFVVASVAGAASVYALLNS